MAAHEEKAKKEAKEQAKKEAEIADWKLFLNSMGGGNLPGPDIACENHREIMLNLTQTHVKRGLKVRKGILTDLRVSKGI